MFLKSGEKTAIICGEQKITYNQVVQKVIEFSGFYKVNSDERVAIFAENRPGWAYAFYSAFFNKSIVVPIDHLSVSSEVAYILNDCKPKVIFSTKTKLPVLQDAVQSLSYTPQIILIDTKEAVQPVVDIPTDFEIPYEPDKSAVIIYTSGTTGHPKGVILTQENLYINIKAVTKDIRIIIPEERILMLLPLHHIFPLQGTLMIPFYLGATIAISPSLATNDILSTLQNNKVSMIIGVPRLYETIHKGIMDKINAKGVLRLLFQTANKINSFGFSRTIFKSVHKKFGGSIRYMIVGGAHISPHIIKDFKTLGFEMLEGYGLTETAPMITFTRPGGFKSGTVGQLLPNVKAETRDGEIVVSGPNVMKGYYNLPEETNKILKNGWFYTGDLGLINKDGYVQITGRKKEMIVLSSGKNIDPVEIEQKLSKSALVTEVGVFQHQGVLMAVIVPDLSISTLSKDKIKERLKWEVLDSYNNNVSPHKKILRFDLVQGELPRTRLGKLQRFKLNSLLESEQNTAQQEVKIDSPEYNHIKDYIEEEKKIKVFPQHHLEIDLALDSLDLVGFQVYIKDTFGIEIDSAKILTFSSVQQLSEYIAKNRIKLDLGSTNWSNILKEKVRVKLPRNWLAGNIVMKTSKWFFRIFFRFKGNGLNNIPEGSCIFAPNHQSFFDGMFVASLLKLKKMRSTYFYAKEKHVRKPWLKYLAARNNVIVMNLQNDLKGSIQKMAEVLKQGNNLIIFPEGTRTKDGEVGSFKKTFAILSSELNVPVVPVSINGAFEAFPRGTWFPKLFRKVKVEFHKPILPTNETYESIIRKVKDAIAQFNR